MFMPLLMLSFQQISKSQQKTQLICDVQILYLLIQASSLPTKGSQTQMIIDIAFVAVIIGILIAIYKTKFSKTKTPEQLRSQIVKEKQSSNVSDNQKPTESQKDRPASSGWTGEASDSQSSESEDGREEKTMNTRKQLYKQQKKREREHRKQAHEQFLSQEKKKREEYEKEMEKKELEEEERRIKQEEYIEQMRAEERKRKQEEFNKWKDMFQVEESGVSKESEDKVQQKQAELEKKLLDHLVKKKVAQLDDVCLKFSLTTKDLVENIKKLEKEGRVSGVFDERGKYIYIDGDEWSAIKSYISTRGRMKKTDLMSECAKIIKLPEADEEDNQLAGLIDEEQAKSAVK